MSEFDRLHSIRPLKNYTIVTEEGSVGNITLGVRKLLVHDNSF